MEIKSLNPKLKQEQIAKALACSTCTLERYTLDINTQSPYKSNNPKRPQKTTDDPIRPQKESLTDVDSTNFRYTNKKNNKKGGDLNDFPIHGRVLIEQVFPY